MYWIYGGFLSLAGLILVNLYTIQIQSGASFREKADDQYMTASSHVFERGTIFFTKSNGEKRVAAGQKKGIKISVNPSRLEHKRAREIFDTFQEEGILLPHVGLKRFSQDSLRYLEIARQLPRQKAESLKERFGKDIRLHSEKWRIYPFRKSAAHILGFLAYDSHNSYAGRYGLERFYEDTLVRSDKKFYVNLFARIFHGLKSAAEGTLKREGSIVTSIDPDAQIFLEKEVSKIQDRWDAASTGGIILNPQNGEIVAMVSAPTFDNNNFKYEELAMFNNPLVSSAYEFGSVLKPLVVAIALDKKLINAKTNFYDRGSVVVEDYTIYNFDKRGRGWVTTQDILNQSLNTGMVAISKKIKKSDFREYFKKYGFGSKSGVDLPNDIAGLVRNLKSNRDIEFANMSFGQGIAVSPLVLAKSLSTLAHGGKPVHPHLARSIEYTDGFSKKIELDDNEQAISSETAAEVSRMLVNVFDRYQKGAVKFEHYSVAAKTGTAQIPNPKGSYYKDRNLHSFFAYFPAYKPRFLVVLYTVHPKKKAKYASQTLIEPFRNIAQYLINSYHIAPDR